jgi:hypothetical protein
VTGKRNPKPKNLWYGIFNGQRHVYYLYCYAHTEKQARVLFCKQIAKKQGVQDWMALQYFKEGGENYQIKLEMEITEDDQAENQSH